jgi:glycosyltransferase involved in cell wall biosynthesis
MKILFYHNYDMQQAWRNWKEGLGPDLHLFGINYLVSQGIQVTILRHKSGFIREASKYGNLNQQVRAAFRGSLYPVVYCGFFSDARFLALLRQYHFLKTDLLSVLHGPVERNELNCEALKAHWKITVLSRSLYTECISAWPEFKDRFIYIPWGTDLHFYPKPCCDPQPEGYILSIGITRRDFKTIVAAARKCDRRFVICAPFGSNLSPDDLPSNVLLHEHSYMSYADVFQLYRNCLAVAIPLDLPDNYRGTQIGITSLIEAMAMGRPVLMTRHPLIDINIQDERIGYWTHTKDADSWINAIMKISIDPTQAAEMGQRGRLLCEDKYNTTRYGEDLYRLIKEHPKFKA